MITRRFVVMAALTSLALLYVRPEVSGPAALEGQVSSTEEGFMEGVLVSAQRAGSTVSVTVVSDAQGRYNFPQNRLQPGRHFLSIRAVGYELNEPREVEVTAQTTRLDVKLHKVQNLAPQLTNAEWQLSMPGTDEQKRLLLNCRGCHTFQRIVSSRHTPDEWMEILPQMNDYYVPGRRQRPRADGGSLFGGNLGMEQMAGSPEKLRIRAEYLSSINLSSVSRWEYPLKTLPRPKGRATRVIITEYDLPRPDGEPHDVMTDSTGMVWYSDFKKDIMGRLDPKTAETVEYPTPTPKPSNAQGINDVELDKDENIWLGTMRQGSFVRFDRKTEKFQLWRLPKEVDNDRSQLAMVNPRQSHVDGKVWSNNVGRRGIQRLDVSSGQIDTVNPYEELYQRVGKTVTHSVYGIAVDSKNNLYFMDHGGEEYIGRVDAKTLKVTLWPTPTPHSAPRRGQMDSQDRLWFAEDHANKIAMFDPRTEKIQEWTLPTPWTNPYDVMLDKNGEAWTGGMSTDRVVRLDPKTGQFTEYLLPRSTNIRRVHVDNSTTPVTFWVGSNHGSSVIRLEPLD
ncbi:MAG: carboxypeptidase regulatory-like domain-containing protein [Acidobacteria bacterium]|nr:carboxypeptidase regulatory-like domain-containing protein [Acidobacteriota bacterium]